MKLGVLVNPIAGLGGRVGLKGTDTPGIVAKALALGATAQAPAKMIAALEALAGSLESHDIEVTAGPGLMGEAEAKQAGFHPIAVGTAPGDKATTPEDTRRVARAMRDAGVGLILFAGGDGTARDVQAAIGTEVAVLGVPSGVKMHSAVFAANPRAAGELAHRCLSGNVPLRDLEVMDIDEEAYRDGRVSAALYGYLRVPFALDLVQGVKLGGGQRDDAVLRGIAEAVAEQIAPGRLVLLGPGTTMRAVGERLGVGKTLLGVDIVHDGRLLAADASEQAILSLLGDGAAATIVVSPIGGQGFIFGRGNQQMSAAVIRRVGIENVIVVATEAKLARLHGQCLRIDTGDAALDAQFLGYRRVITGYGTMSICRVMA
ncbi:MAG: ATP-NAD kinase family protein [Alphaproteobacteria bacterium]